MLKPSFFRPKIAAIEPSLVVHQVGKLSPQDLLEVDRRLRQALALKEAELEDMIREVDLMTQPAPTVQTMAEKAIAALISFDSIETLGTDLGMGII